MSEVVTHFKVLFGCPSDAQHCHQTIRSVVDRWNRDQSSVHRVVISLVNWSSNSVPEVGAPPQTILNRQLADICDILVVVFSARMGTPTEDHISGTVEEIKRFESQNKPVVIYFSDEGVKPKDIDPSQLTRLNEFRKEYAERALFGDFSTEIEFRDKLYSHLMTTVLKLHKRDSEKSDSLNDIAESIPRDGRVPGVRKSQQIGSLIGKSLTGLVDSFAKEGCRTDTISLGFADLDYYLGGGLQPKCLYIVSGFPSCGKSSFMRSVVLSAIHASRRPLVFTLNENDLDYATYLLCMEAGIPYVQYRSGELRKKDYQKIGLSAGTFVESKATVLSRSVLTMDEIQHEIESTPNHGEPGAMAVIDDLYRLFINEQKIAPETSFEVFASRLKDMASNLSIPILASYPLPFRQVQLIDHRPHMSDFGPAYPLWEFSSAVFFLHGRPDLAIEDREHLAELIVEKNQFGRPGQIYLSINRSSLRFTDVSTELRARMDTLSRANELLS